MSGPLRCAPGDLAVVIAGEQVGLFVTVIEPGEPHPIVGLPSWVCSVSAACKVTIVTTSRRTGRPLGMHRTNVEAGHPVLFCDNELWPIRPRKPPAALPAPSIELETAA